MNNTIELNNEEIEQLHINTYSVLHSLRVPNEFCSHCLANEIKTLLKDAKIFDKLDESTQKTFDEVEADVTKLLVQYAYMVIRKVDYTQENIDKVNKILELGRELTPEIEQHDYLINGGIIKNK
ncbi:hypothetical protein M2T79_09275 [Elizabethkingia miricola]|uniref:hypothetical protein n=1 Tax=Elizabethkingia miricola TaxID=172045 RepID=UPI00201983D3|nr:hypothetical protein [Elizabethkingia miricola]MCL1656789.1 hypothetical protein [Elizabethkingia miricola]